MSYRCLIGHFFVWIKLLLLVNVSHFWKTVYCDIFTCFCTSLGQVHAPKAIQYTYIHIQY